MNEKDYRDKMDEALRYAEDVKQKQEIKEVRHSNDKEKKPLSFSKMAVIFIFVNCCVIELYSMVVMAVFHDLSSLGSLVMAVVGQCASLLGYFIKAGRENTASGIVYETTMMQLQHELGAVNDTEQEQINVDPIIVDEDDGAVG